MVISIESLINQDYIKNFQDLADSIKSSECILFLGSGPSINAGYPGWKKLIVKIAQGLSIPNSEQQDILKEIEDSNTPKSRYPDIAQKMKDINEEEYYKSIWNCFNSPNAKQFCATHIHLINIPFSSYITTNYDPCLKFAARSGRKKIGKIYTTYDLQISDLEKRAIYHIHGIAFDRNNIKSVILAREDYESIYGEDGFVEIFLKAIFTLTKFTILFVGYGFGDPELTKILQFVRKFQIEREKKIRNTWGRQYPNAKYYAIIEEEKIKVDVIVDGTDYGDIEQKGSLERLKEMNIENLKQLNIERLKELNITPIIYNTSEFSREGALDEILGYLSEITEGMRESPLLEIEKSPKVTGGIT